MNFDELREYTIGDDIKDIDWKATARSQKVLVRQYIAEKKHNLLLIMDTNKSMMADSEDGHVKKDLALLCGGALGYMVAENGDYVGAMLTTRQGPKYCPLKTGLVNLEMILDEYEKSVSLDNTSELEVILNYFLHNMRKRMIIVLVTDANGILKVSEQTLRRILTYNDILVMQIGEASLDGGNVYDMNMESYLPAFFAKDKKLIRRAKQRRVNMQAEAAEKCKKLGIPSCLVENLDELDDKIIELLNKNRLENR